MTVLYLKTNLDLLPLLLYIIKMKKVLKNTPSKGQFRHIVFKDGKVWYAVALEFNIIESSEDPRLAYFNLLLAVDGYIAAMQKIKGARNFSALNQKSDEEYKKLWLILNSDKPIKSPYQINSFGITSSINA